MVATATAPTSDSAGDATDDPSARDYFRVSWKILLNQPLLAAARLFGDLFGYLIRPTGIVLLLGLFAIGFGRLGIAEPTLPALLSAVGSIDPTRLLGGLAGIVAIFWLVGLSIDALVSGGIFGTLRDALLGREVGGARRLGACMVEGFPKVVGLRLLAIAAEWTVALLGLSLAVAIGSAFAGGLTETGLLTQTFFISIPAFLFFSFAILVRMTFLIAFAPLFIRDTGIGEAVADGAAFAIEEFAPLYRLIIFAASLLLAPLILYWVFLMAGNVAGINSPYAPLFEAGQVVGQIVLFASFGIVSILFHGALFAFYGDRDDVEEIETAEAHRPTDGESSGVGRGPLPEQTYDETTQIEDLLPEEFDRVVDLKELPGFDDSDDES